MEIKTCLDAKREFTVEFLEFGGEFQVLLGGGGELLGGEVEGVLELLGEVGGGEVGVVLLGEEQEDLVEARGGQEFRGSITSGVGWRMYISFLSPISSQIPHRFLQPVLRMPKAPSHIPHLSLIHSPLLLILLTHPPNILHIPLKILHIPYIIQILLDILPLDPLNIMIFFPQ